MPRDRIRHSAVFCNRKLEVMSHAELSICGPLRGMLSGDVESCRRSEDVQTKVMRNCGRNKLYSDVSTR